MDMTTVNTATLKQNLSYYLGLVNQGKEILITSHKRVVARLLAETGQAARLPLVPPVRKATDLKDIGGFGLTGDPVTEVIKERKKR